MSTDTQLPVGPAADAKTMAPEAPDTPMNEPSRDESTTKTKTHDDTEVQGVKDPKETRPESPKQERNVQDTSPDASRKRRASEAGLEQDRNRDRRREFSQEEKKRGQRLFGGLLSTLSQKPAGRRPVVERKQQEKAQQRKVEDDKRKAEVQERLASLNHTRRIRQVKLDEQTMRARHQDMVAKAHCLKTRSKPHLYYLPWELSPAQEDLVKQQVLDAEETVTREVEEFERLKRQRLNDLGVSSHEPKRSNSNNSSDQRRDSTVGEQPVDTKAPDPSKPTEPTNPPLPKHGPDKEPDDVVETEEDTLIY